MNAWQTLGLPLSLSLSDEDLDAHFRAASEGAHPDAGGEGGRFEEVREARDRLKDDFLRLEAWLLEKGVTLSHSGAISPRVGEMFAQVDALTQGVDAWLEEGATKSSGLGKALWQKEGFAWKTRLDERLQTIAEWQQEAVAQFPDLEAEEDFRKALIVRGELGFLRKWKASLQERFGKIWEGLV